jgi:hypothetical protein
MCPEYVPQLIGLVILGSDFATECAIIIEYVWGCFSLDEQIRTSINLMRLRKSQKVNVELELGDSPQDSRSTASNHLISCSVYRDNLPCPLINLQPTIELPHNHDIASGVPESTNRVHEKLNASRREEASNSISGIR